MADRTLLASTLDLAFRLWAANGGWPIGGGHAIQGNPKRIPSEVAILTERHIAARVPGRDSLMMSAEGGG